MYKKGDICAVKVTCVEDYGAFVKTNDDYTGLIHISEITLKFVKDVNDFFKIGDIINAEIISVDEEKKQLNLSVKSLKKNNELIMETYHGFSTLKANLPIWIEKKLKNIEKEKISLDKR